MFDCAAVSIKQSDFLVRSRGPGFETSPRRIFWGETFHLLSNEARRARANVS